MTSLRNSSTGTLTLIAALLAAAGAAHAEIVQGNYTDTDSCDNHGNLTATEEFGDPSVFADDEAISHVSTFTDETACPGTDDPNLPNSVIEIINLTGRRLTDLYYVGDSTTTFSNVDGVANAGVFPDLLGPAFRIDAKGVNTPLIFESITSDGVFEPNEAWLFIVQDYSNSNGLAPDSFLSIGFADASLAIVESSAASIVQFVPSPGPAATLILASTLITRRRRAAL